MTFVSASGAHTPCLNPGYALLACLMFTACAPTGTGADPDAGSGSDAGPNAGTRISSTIQSSIEEARIAGASAAIFDATRVVWSGAYGMADVETERAVQTDTIFMLASISKLVTTLTVMHAVEAGLVDLDADIQSYLPFAVRHPTAANPITTRQLLTHSSGIHDDYDFLEDQYTFGSDSPESLRDFLERYLSPEGTAYSATHFSSEPGTTWEYSNYAFALAGFVVEAGSGMAFSEYSRIHVLAPLGMTDSTWFLAQTYVSRAAVPHQYFRRAIRSIGHFGYPDYPSGQLRSTTRDIARVAQLVLGRGVIDGTRVLSEASMDEMLRRQGPGLSRGQALGWFWDGPNWLGHSGGDPGVATQMLVNVETGMGLVLLCNGDSGDGAEFENMVDVLRGATEELDAR